MKYYVVVTNGITAKHIEVYLDETKAIERVTELNVYYMEHGYEVSAHLTPEDQVSNDMFLDGLNLG